MSKTTPAQTPLKPPHSNELHPATAIAHTLPCGCEVWAAGFGFNKHGGPIMDGVTVIKCATPDLSAMGGEVAELIRKAKNIAMGNRRDGILLSAEYHEAVAAALTAQSAALAEEVKT